MNNESESSRHILVREKKSSHLHLKSKPLPPFSVSQCHCNCRPPAESPASSHVSSHLPAMSHVDSKGFRKGETASWIICLSSRLGVASVHVLRESHQRQWDRRLQSCAALTKHDLQTSAGSFEFSSQHKHANIVNALSWRQTRGGLAGVLDGMRGCGWSAGTLKPVVNCVIH